jgi:hypothetical protein
VSATRTIMLTRLFLALWMATVCPYSIDAAGARARLIEARDLAYDANYRNDQAGLRSAIDAMRPLTKAADVGVDAHYYLSWTYWALAASQVQEKNMTAALESGKLALEHARAGVAARDTDAELQTALANALIVVGILDKAQFKERFAELPAVRARALELGPSNPRAAIMDAGIIFNTPVDAGGNPERGIARWQEALKLFEAEANARAIDPLKPRWGHALAYGWMATLYLRLTPPQTDKAREAAETALAMRPDFWWVRDQVLPQLRE